MKLEPTTLIILGVLCVALGFIANVLLGMLREDVEPEGRPDDSVDSAPPGGRKGKYVPVVRLWRERQTGKLVVEVDGKSLVSSEPLTEIQRERLEKAARDFRVFLGMGLAGRNVMPEPDPQMVETPVPPQLEQPADSQGSSAQPPAPAPAQPVVTPTPARVATPAPASRQVAKPSGGKAKGEPSPIEEAAASVSGSKSIVAQIEDILQDMLVGGPLAHRGIHLNEDPVRGVIVSDGIHRYEGIDSVPDPEVKAIIRAAVAEWEKSQG